METRQKPAHSEVIVKRRNELIGACATFLTPQAELVLEVGCGHGHFLNAYAKAHSETLCVGIDIEKDRIERADRKRERAKLSNLHFLRADARDFVEVMPPGARIKAVYMLFPDPWPKRRHHKHRLLDARFLTAVARRAGQGTRFYFRTDFEPYFSAAAAVFASDPNWDMCPNEAWPFDLPTIFQEKASKYHSLVAVRNRH